MYNSISKFIRGESPISATDQPDEPTAILRNIEGQPEAYYTAVLALLQGSKHPHRPELPEELVLMICRLADFFLSYVIEEKRGFNVLSSGSEEESVLWLKTPPMTAEIIHRIRGIQLTTDSCHQGWVSSPSDGSWSWFDIGVFRPGATRWDELRQKTLPDDSLAEWNSHVHRVDMEDYETCAGTDFDRNHPIWDHTEPGDVIVVTAKAQFPGWQNKVRGGTLKISVCWEPSLAMLDMIYGSK